MPAPKWEKIKDVINKDCEIRFKYIDDDGRTCLVGGLIKAAGGNVKELMGENTKCTYDEANMAGVKFIEKNYGLNDGQIDILQNINDRFKERHERQKYLMIQVQAFEDGSDQMIDLIDATRDFEDL